MIVTSPTSQRRVPWLGTLVVSCRQTMSVPILGPVGETLSFSTEAAEYMMANQQSAMRKMERVDGTSRENC